MDLLSKHQSEKSTVHSNKEDISQPQNQSNREYEEKSEFTQSLPKDTHISGDPISLRESIIPAEETNVHAQVEFQCEDLSRASNRSNMFKVNSLESELRLLKMQLNDMEQENGILKKNLATLSLAKSSTVETEQRYSVSPSEQREIEEMRSKLNDLQNENENLRQEILKVKTESFRKFETLQKNNDELLESYEQRVSFH